MHLEVIDFRDETRWRWRLTSEDGEFLADHSVTLNRGDSEYEGFAELYQFLNWHVDRERGPDEERRLIEQLGRWVAQHVWGPVGRTIDAHSKRAPTVVHVRLPPEAEILLFRPLELGFIGGQPVTRRDVSLVFELDGEAHKQPAPIGRRLRILAIFSTPADQGALNVRYERYELGKLIDRIAHTAERAIELRVLQYGVTREALREVLSEPEGWDIIHFSGHGLPAGLRPRTPTDRPTSCLVANSPTCCGRHVGN